MPQQRQKLPLSGKGVSQLGQQFPSGTAAGTAAGTGAGTGAGTRGTGGVTSAAWTGGASAGSISICLSSWALSSTGALGTCNFSGVSTWASALWLLGGVDGPFSSSCALALLTRPSHSFNVCSKQLPSSFNTSISGREAKFRRAVRKPQLSAASSTCSLMPGATGAAAAAAGGSGVASAELTAAFGVLALALALASPFADCGFSLVVPVPFASAFALALAFALAFASALAFATARPFFLPGSVAASS
mmetsp:Transcript_75087/g.119276  ORF Transcript_75087/g.119276 Transcript_75087/m.119276 type:complete len:247 (-) Transcript_75087:790-1530(-)